MILRSPFKSIFPVTIIFFLFLLVFSFQAEVNADDQLPADDFNDNTIGDIWFLIESAEPTELWFEEANQRLEGRLTGSVSDATTVLTSNKWKLSTGQDFSMKVDWHFSGLPSAIDYAGIGLGVFKSLTPQTDVNIEVDTEGGEAYFSIDSHLNGSESGDYNDKPRTVNNGKFYISYDSINDRLYLSINEYLQSNNPDNGDWVFDGLLKGSWSADEVSVMLNFFCENNNDIAFNSDNAYFDNFQVNQGSILGNCEDGDINCDGNIDLTDAILSLKIAVGINPDQLIFISADVNNDGRIGLPESIYALNWIAGQKMPEEFWAAEMFDDSGQSMGFLNFTLEQQPEGEVLANGDYDVVVSMPPVTNRPVQGDFSDQPMAIDGNTLSTVYAGTLLVNGMSITFTLTITGTTDNGYATGQWNLDFLSNLLQDQNGTWTGQRQSGSGITQ